MKNKNSDYWWLKRNIICNFWIFRIKDWDVYTALSMEEALKVISTKKLDIIIIDYHMPYINGVLGVN